MTTPQQRGYDDQIAGREDEVWMNEDSPAGRDYRDGRRRARWALQDAAEGVHVAPQRPEALAFEPSSPPAIALPAPEPDAPASIPSAAPGGAAFNDAAPKEGRKPRKTKADPSAQLDLFG